jgi:hypothetical protein
LVQWSQVQSFPALGLVTAGSQREDKCRFNTPRNSGFFYFVERKKSPVPKSLF